MDSIKIFFASFLFCAAILMAVWFLCQVFTKNGNCCCSELKVGDSFEFFMDVDNPFSEDVVIRGVITKMDGEYIEYKSVNGGVGTSSLRDWCRVGCVRKL